ncbi:MAG: ABC transporter ATP-binding protein [Bacteroidales bacterium]|jgi:iron complex transport system ATP-binding protein|nr:ABC transporter ATP-binding protein [Bacteroidales bacterium]HHT53269.1 ABC transporter ATP-binding protein [Bacteroidales bacterium]
MTPIIEVSHLSFAYDQVKVLKNLNFTLQQGTYCALMGANGSGKTTLGKLICGLLHGFQGEIKINGKSINHLSQLDIAKLIAVVPQRQDLMFDFTVYETVMMGRNPHLGRWESPSEKDHQIVREALHKTHLIEFKDRFTHQLSGGEFQRTLIARAIAQKTPILILDEPLSNLDIAHKFEIMEILRELNEQHQITIILILHEFAFAVQYVPLSLLLQSGEELYYGETKQLFSTPLVKNGFNLKDPFTIDHNGNSYKIHNI